MLKAVLVVLTATVSAAYAQVPTSKTMTAICAEEMGSGFSWKNGKWEPAKFKTDTKFHVKRYSTEELQERKKNATENAPWRCLAETDDMEKVIDVSRIGEVGKFVRRGCYIINELGRKPLPMLDAEVCYESYDKSELVKVQCQAMHFHPNGLFIRLPWSTAMDVSQSPKDDYKDSLSLAVGKCSSID